MEDKKWYQNKKIIIIAVVALVAVIGLSAFLALGRSSDLATVTTFPENDTTFRYITDGNAYPGADLALPEDTTVAITERVTEDDDYYGYDYDDDYYDYYDEDDYYDDEDDYYDDEDDYYDDEDDYYEDEEYYDEYDDEYDDYDESEDEEW